jgi:hypothetical protein
MKFYLRRFIVAVVTLPIVFTVYAALYFGIGLLTLADANDFVPIGPYLYNLPAIGFGYVVTIVLLPQIYNLVDRLTD